MKEAVVVKKAVGVVVVVCEVALVIVVVLHDAPPNQAKLEVVLNEVEVRVVVMVLIYS